MPSNAQTPFTLNPEKGVERVISISALSPSVEKNPEKGVERSKLDIKLPDNEGIPKRELKVLTLSKTSIELTKESRKGS